MRCTTDTGGVLDSGILSDIGVKRTSSRSEVGFTDLFGVTGGEVENRRSERMGGEDGEGLLGDIVRERNGRLTEAAGASLCSDASNNGSCELCGVDGTTDISSS